ncbi:MAG TPA: hypothetical protein VM841_05855, partial [Actinomycetota bacterium]|nr:hypothetical protein [Actinomycetota bacterium]
MKRRHRRLAYLVALAAIAGLLPQAARAATISVNCLNQADDLLAVQAAVQSASSGDTIQLSGVCDFTTAAPHGGDATSIEAGAILVRPAAISNLTIEGADANATVIGNGLSAAFVIGPAAINTTIRRLRFVNFARSVVAINTTGTTVGADDGALPSANGLRIVASATADSSIQGLAVSRNPESAPLGNVTVKYGANGMFTYTFPGQAAASLTNFRVAGNYITYAPPGAGVPDVAAIDVRQRFYRMVNGVRIANNAVGMLTPTFLTTNVAAIKLHSTSPADPVTNTIADYLIRNVDISNNNLGRIEELGNPLADINAAGRVGILLIGVANFNVIGNGIRTVQTPTVVPMPGGGIIASDSRFGRIAGNGINTIATHEGETSDFGGIAVVDEFVSAFDGAPKPQASADIVIEDNLLGTNAPGPGINGRGIVAAGSTRLTVRNNTTELTLQEALAIAPVLEGPGSLSTPGPIPLPATVTNSVFCGNVLDGVVDDPNEVSYGEGGGTSTNNTYPGGTLPANAPCPPSVPTLIFVPTDNTPPKVYEEGETSDSVSIRLSEPPAADVTVTMTTDAQTTALTASLTFTPATWHAYQWAMARAIDDLVVEGTHFSTITFTFSSADPRWNTAPAVTTPFIVIDNDLGLVDITPQFLNIGESGPNGTYSVVLTEAPTADVLVNFHPDTQLFVAEHSIKFTPLNWNVPRIISVVAVDDIIREGTPHFGTITHSTTSSQPRFDQAAVPSVVASITDNDNPDSPSILAPGGGSCTSAGSVAFSGRGEEGALVELYENNVLIGSATVVGGLWASAMIPFGPGQHTVSARQIGSDGLIGRQWASITFTVDTVAPAAPVITSPADGATLTGNPHTIEGTAEPYARVQVRRNGFPVALVTASASGSWSASIFLPAGPQALDAIAFDCALNASAPSGTVNVDSAGVTEPVIVTPAEGAITRATVLVTGFGPAGATLIVKEAGRELRRTTVTASGDWSLTLTGLSGGEHKITATATAGGYAETSPVRTF